MSSGRTASFYLGVPPESPSSFPRILFLKDPPLFRRSPRAPVPFSARYFLLSSSGRVGQVTARFFSDPGRCPVFVGITDPLSLLIQWSTCVHVLCFLLLRCCGPGYCFTKSPPFPLCDMIPVPTRFTPDPSLPSGGAPTVGSYRLSGRSRWPFSALVAFSLPP